MDPLGAQDPKRVGPYRLLGRLGAGGMGQVFLGQDRRGVQVAVKVVHPGFAHDERFRLRFRREVEISRTVTGPWVAAVVDADPDARTPWLATQYVRGPSLGAAVQAGGPLPTAAVHALAHGLANALAAVHEAGLVHRDLKPSNVLLGDDHPRLIDFGISRAIDGTQVTSTGVVVGTPAFMSPEQIAGEAVGPASDVFSLGSVLAFAATGRSPFGDHPPLVLMMRISGHEPDLDGVPDVLRGPIAACLAKRPEDRPTCGELSGMLGTVGAAGPAWTPSAATPGDPVSTLPGPPTAAEMPMAAAAGRGTRRRVVVAGALGLGAAALMGAGGLGVAAILGTETGSPSLPVPRPAPPRVRWAASLDNEALERSNVWAADDSSVYAYGEDVLHPLGDESVLQAVDSATGAVRWTVPGWAPADGTDHNVTLVPVAGSGGVVVGTGTVVAMLDAATGQRRWEVPRSVGSARIAVADGIVCTAMPDGLVALDVSTGDRLWSVDHDPTATFINVAALRGVCFVIGVDGGLVARDLRSGTTVWRYRTGVESTEGLAELLATDGVVYAAHAATLWAVDAATGRLRWQTALGDPNWVLHRDGVRTVGDLIAVYARSTTSSVVLGIDPTSATLRWSVPPPGETGVSNPIGIDGPILVRPPAGPVLAYDSATGEPLWAYGSGGLRPVAAYGPDVYLVGDGHLHAVTAA